MTISLQRLQTTHLYNTNKTYFSDPHSYEIITILPLTQTPISYYFVNRQNKTNYLVFTQKSLYLLYTLRNPYSTFSQNTNLPFSLSFVSCTIDNWNPFNPNNIISYFFTEFYSFPHVRYLTIILPFPYRLPRFH